MIKTLTARSVAILLLGFRAGAAFAGLETLTGVGPWTEHSAVYAEVASVKDLGSARASVTLRVRATLTGFYDAAEGPVLETRLSYNPFASAIRKPPKPNDRVVAVLYRRSDGRIFIEAAQCLYMPDYAGLVVVKGFDDPKVSAIITRLQEVRGMKLRPGLSWPELSLELIKKEEQRRLEEIKKKQDEHKKSNEDKEKVGTEQKTPRMR